MPAGPCGIAGAEPSPLRAVTDARAGKPTGPLNATLADIHRCTFSAHAERYSTLRQIRPEKAWDNSQSTSVSPSHKVILSVSLCSFLGTPAVCEYYSRGRL